MGGAFARDISEREHVEKRLHDAEQTYRVLLDCLDDGYFEMDLEGAFTYIDDRR